MFSKPEYSELTYGFSLNPLICYLTRASRTYALAG